MTHRRAGLVSLQAPADIGCLRPALTELSLLLRLLRVEVLLLQLLLLRLLRVVQLLQRVWVAMLGKRLLECLDGRVVVLQGRVRRSVRTAVDKRDCIPMLYKRCLERLDGQAISLRAGVRQSAGPKVLEEGKKSPCFPAETRSLERMRTRGKRQNEILIDSGTGSLSTTRRTAENA
jgi:hypothetical protein